MIKLKNVLMFLVFIPFFLCSCEKKAIPKGKFNLETFILESRFKDIANDSLMKSELRRQIMNASGSDSDYIVEQYGAIFHSKFKYLIILDQKEGGRYWFKKIPSGFNSFYRQEESADFVKDTVLDINNDKKYELATTTHTTGPDQKIISFIGSTGLITKKITLDNFHIIDNDKFIQVFSHSSPYVCFLKCKWNATSIDTLERIVFDTNNTSKIYIVRDNNFTYSSGNIEAIDKSKIIRTLTKLPKDYKIVLNEYYPEIARKLSE